MIHMEISVTKDLFYHKSSLLQILFLFTIERVSLFVIYKKELFPYDTYKLLETAEVFFTKYINKR